MTGRGAQLCISGSSDDGSGVWRFLSPQFIRMAGWVGFELIRNGKKFQFHCWYLFYRILISSCTNCRGSLQMANLLNSLIHMPMWTNLSEYVSLEVLIEWPVCWNAAFANINNQDELQTHWKVLKLELFSDFYRLTEHSALTSRPFCSVTLTKIARLPSMRQGKCLSLQRNTRSWRCLSQQNPNCPSRIKSKKRFSICVVITLFIYLFIHLP